jgi:hypothetical protein
MRSFVLFLSVINLLVKAGVVGCLGMLFKDQLLSSRAATSEDVRGGYDMSPVVRGI